MLHWDGRAWTPSRSRFRRRARRLPRARDRAANRATPGFLPSSPRNPPTPPVGRALSARAEGEGTAAKWSWKPVAAAKEGEAQPLHVPVKATAGGPEAEPFTVHGIGEPPTVVAQVLTVTSEGLVGRRRARRRAHARTGEHHAVLQARRRNRWQGAGQLVPAPRGRAAGTPECEQRLPEALPIGPSRSIAWADGSQFGERVVTGLPEGVSLSLHGDTFERVLALGAGAGSEGDPGAGHGAAFTSPHEGWLGGRRHARAPHANAASQPPLAVAGHLPPPAAGDRAAARRIGRRAHLRSARRRRRRRGRALQAGPGMGARKPVRTGRAARHDRLRAVAWPTPDRAYAVGDALEGKQNRRCGCGAGKRGCGNPTRRRR